MNMNESEVKFLLAVERGDFNKIRELLDKRDEIKLDINCRDPLARSALIIAIDKENLEVIKLLLEAKIEIGDGLLYAINENFVEAVELLLDSGPSRQWHDDSFFSADMTPLMLAAHRNNFEIIEMLLDRNVSPIVDPHDPRCECPPCCSGRNEDCLKHSQTRINSYRALVSPSLMALSSPDPLLAAFKMSEKLEKLAKLEPEYKEEYLRLRTQCQKFVVRLLDQTRTSKELETLLGSGLACLKLAIQCKQKTFCAHPNIQELLASMWYENLPGFRRKSFIAQAIQVISIGLMFPVYSIAYLMAPHSQFGSYIKKPFIKFICHSASYITFLLVLILASQRVEAFYNWSGVLELLSSMTMSHQKQHYNDAQNNFTALWKQVNQDTHMTGVPTNLDNLDVETLAALYKQLGESASSARSLDSLSKIFGQLPASSKKRGTLPSPIETIIVIWVISLIWAEIKQIKSLGMNYYKHDMWNILDSVASGFYVGAIILRIISFCEANEKTLEVAREHWNAYDPTLLSEGLFATATIFSALKLVYIFSLNPYLGPLQISLGRMIIDILRFSWIYLLVLFAFACGMNQLLWYYADLERHQCLNATNYSLSQYYSGLKLQEISNKAINSSDPLASAANVTIIANLNDEKFNPSLEDDSSKPPVTIDDSCKTWRHFSNVFESSQTLFWANFGLVDLENFELTGIRQYTRFWALLMFGCYCFINVIVVLNLLVAMMNHSYVKISKRSDVEWKFARTRLWMSYFDTGSTVPSPFNIIPSIKSIKYIMWSMLKRCHYFDSEKTPNRQVNHQMDLFTTPNISPSQSYRSVIKCLVKRYLVQEQRILEKNRSLTEAKLTRWTKWGHKHRLE